MSTMYYDMHGFVTPAPPAPLLGVSMKVSYDLPTETVAGLVGIVPALEKARLYRGRGGELMRQAACRLVECLALTKTEVAVKTQVRRGLHKTLASQTYDKRFFLFHHFQESALITFLPGRSSKPSSHGRFILPEAPCPPLLSCLTEIGKINSQNERPVSTASPELRICRPLCLPLLADSFDH